MRIKKKGESKDNLAALSIKTRKKCWNIFFLECSFANEVWCTVLKEIHFSLTLPTIWKDFFACWKDYYHGSLIKKLDFSRAWVTLPKYICWK